MWFILTMICAISQALSDTYAKKSRASEDPYVIAAIRFGFAMPFLWAFAPFTKIPLLGADFWPTFAVMVPLEITAGIMYVRALRKSPMYLTLPLLAFSPVLIVVTGALVLGEYLHLGPIFGIICISVGAYMINLGQGKGFLAPIKALVIEPGSRLMIGVAVIYSITSVAGKKALLASSPAFFMILYFTAVGAVFLILLPVMSPKKWRDIFHPDLDAWLCALFQAVMIIAHNFAMVLVEAGVMISIKRTSLLFGVLFGYLFFKEANFPRHFLATLLMVCGVALIILLR